MRLFIKHLRPGNVITELYHPKSKRIVKHLYQLTYQSSVIRTSLTVCSNLKLLTAHVYSFDTIEYGTVEIDSTEFIYGIDVIAENRCA